MHIVFWTKRHTNLLDFGSSFVKNRLDFGSSFVKN